MADHPNPGLRDQLIKDRDALAPQIRGLDDLPRTSVSADAIAALNKQRDARIHRRNLIQDVLDILERSVDGLDALQADGWPAEVATDELSNSVFEELQEEQSDVQAAVAVFRQKQAASLRVSLGEPEPKPT